MIRIFKKIAMKMPVFQMMLRNIDYNTLAVNSVDLLGTDSTNTLSTKKVVLNG